MKDNFIIKSLSIITHELSVRMTNFNSEQCASSLEHALMLQAAENEKSYLQGYSQSQDLANPINSGLRAVFRGL